VGDVDTPVPAVGVLEGVVDVDPVLETAVEDLPVVDDVAEPPDVEVEVEVPAVWVEVEVEVVVTDRVEVGEVTVLYQPTVIGAPCATPVLVKLSTWF
jgi:hypothetical protein